MKVKVVETFVSIQGEGLHVGVPSLFVRLFGCNFTCSGFSNPNPVGDIPIVDLTNISEVSQLDGNSFTRGCDSAYSWHKDYAHLAKEYNLEELYSYIELTCKDTIKHIVWTGGEPMMNQKALFWLIKKLPGYVHTIETNGSIPLLNSTLNMFKEREYGYGHLRYNILFSVSPKLEHSGEPYSKRFNPKAIRSYMAMNYNEPFINVDLTYKVVCDNESHVDEALKLCKALSTPDVEHAESLRNMLILSRKFKERFMVMPLGATIEQYNEVATSLAKICIERGIKFTPRLHLSLFGNAVGT